METETIKRKIEEVAQKIAREIDLLVYRPDSIEKRKDMGDPFITDLLLRGRTLYAR